MTNADAVSSRKERVQFDKVRLIRSSFACGFLQANRRLS